MPPTVEVKNIKNRFFPCEKCRNKNNPKFPNTRVHMAQQYSTNMLRIANFNCGAAAIEIVGPCEDFVQIT